MAELIAILQSWVDSAGLKIIITDAHAIGLVLALVAIFVIVLALVFRTSEKEVIEKTSELKPEVKEESQKEESQKEASHKEENLKAEIPAKDQAPQISWSERLTKGLSKSRQDVWGKLSNIFKSNELSGDDLDEIEEILYGADIGPVVAGELIEAISKKFKAKELDPSNFKSFIKEFLTGQFGEVQNKAHQDLFQFTANSGLKVIMIVGVNGAGKTTTIGKLATKLTSQGAKVVVGACDTFRAAAVDQLQVWCERANATMIRAKEGANPSGVGYDALQTAINENADYCILDTAGRLHTAENLMDELTKSKNVLKKLMPEAPHHVLLVIDAITGQNAIKQASEFNKALDLTGLIFTKCDGSSKAGSAISIVKNLQVPITYIGVGENVEDLNKFELKDYLDALVGN